MVEEECLKPSRFVESDAPQIVAFAEQVAGRAASDIERAVLVFNAVRDGIAYDPYDWLDLPQTFSAARALQRGRGYCIPKAALLVASARALGIAARLGFADVRNHLASPRLTAANNGNVFRWHAFAELRLADRWVKATPTFDRVLCDRAGIEPLGFDGRADSVFHSYDRRKRKHMEYVLDRGRFAGVPAESILATWRTFSPALFDRKTFAGARAFSEEMQNPG